MNQIRCYLGSLPCTVQFFGAIRFVARDVASLSACPTLVSGMALDRELTCERSCAPLRSLQFSPLHQRRCYSQEKGKPARRSGIDFLHASRSRRKRLGDELPRRHLRGRCGARRTGVDGGRRDLGHRDVERRKTGAAAICSGCAAPLWTRNRSARGLRARAHSPS